MEEKIKIFFIATLILFFPVMGLDYTSAQESKEEILKALVTALNNDTETVYESYSEFVDKLGKTEDAEKKVDLFIYELVPKMKVWRESLEGSLSVYEKYIYSGNSEISEISNLAMSGAEKGIEAIDNYEVALASKSENDLLFYLNQGDQLMMSSVQDHDQAVVLYNDYSGVSEALMLRNGLIVGSIISILFSVILFFKARIHPGIQAEMIRANIYKGLFQSSAWMTAGILITTISYLFVFEKGGTYLIFYGPVLVGGWQLLRGLSKYFTKDRKVLKELSRAERESIIKQTYEKPGEEEEIIDVGKKCPHCDNPIPSKAIICPNCGKNVL